jgi:hypothetical protein
LNLDSFRDTPPWSLPYVPTGVIGIFPTRVGKDDDDGIGSRRFGTSGAEEVRIT